MVLGSGLAGLHLFTVENWLTPGGPITPDHQGPKMSKHQKDVVSTLAPAPHYRRERSILRCWYPWGILEPISHDTKGQLW